MAVVKQLGAKTMAVYGAFWVSWSWQGMNKEKKDDMVSVFWLGQRMAAHALSCCN